MSLATLWLVQLVIDRLYVDVTCLVTQYNGHTFTYAHTHSTTPARTTVLQFLCSL